MTMGRSWLLALLILSGRVDGWAAEDPTGPDLSQAIAQLIEAQAQLQGAGAVANIALPGGLDDVLIVRRTIAADWQRRLEAQTARPDDAALVRFTDELNGLVTSLQQLTNLAQQLADAPRRFPHCLTEPAFTRYRALVGEAFTQGLQAVIAGRPRDQVKPAIWFRRQARHTTLLMLIESGYQADERYASLPRDDRWLIEYREHLLLTRATVEHTLEADDERSHRHQAVLQAYTRLLDERVQLSRRIAGCGLPADAPEVATFRRTGEAQVEILGRLVGLARSTTGDEEEQWRHEQQEQRRSTRTRRLADIADQWLSFERERRDQAEDLADQLHEAPAGQAAATRAILEACATAHRTAQQAFAQAVEADDLAAALAAKQAVEQARHLSGRQLARLDEDSDIAERESSWRVHAKDPAMAEKLREWTERRAAALAARHAADAAADAALAATHAAERAQLASDEAEEQAQRLQDAADRHDLWELMEALDEMTELRAGAAPQQ